MKDIDDFIRQVKSNCNISDAQFWGYYSICGLLMRYRELYRNEHSLMPWDSIANEEVAQWIHEREMLWKDLEDAELQMIVIEGRGYDPFDIDGLNAVLQDTGLLYGAGYATFSKPTFFVASLDAAKDYYDYHVHYAGSELCRDLAASPAMLQGRCIHVRPAVITVIIWDRFQEMKAKRCSGLADEMFSHYNIGENEEISENLFRKITDMSSGVSDVFVLHEAGEAYEDEFSDEWREILWSGCDKATELYLRGIKDIRADTSCMGPLKSIVDGRDRRRLCFFLALLDGIRKDIFPEIRDVFQQFAESEDWALIEKARTAGYRRAEILQSKVIDAWRTHKNTAAVASFIRDTFQKPRIGQ